MTLITPVTNSAASSQVKRVNLPPTTLPGAPAANETKRLFQNNQAVVYAMSVRTFGSLDRNRDGKVSFSMGESGTFLKAAAELDNLKKLGVNVIHILPITQSGRVKRLGNAGSIYAMSDPGKINPELDDHRVSVDVETEARYFVQKAHEKGIKIMIDLPSCVAKEVENTHPDLLVRDKTGKILVPANWIDIMMIKPGGKDVEQFFQPFFDLVVDRLGVDGIRADVARARDLSFWKTFIQQKYPHLAWLGETYTEQAAPLTNIPRDIPEDLLKQGFDSVYGQFHIFHHWDTAEDYQKYLTDNYWMLRRAGAGKSFIGSFLTHDDVSLMPAGGVLQYNLTSGLMATQPWSNPYILDGYTTGFEGEFDIFNYSKKPEGRHPEIGQFLQNVMQLRQQPGSQQNPGPGQLMTKGWYVPLPVQSTDRKNQIVAFARHLQGKTLLVVANKDVNARHTGNLTIPGLPKAQLLQNLVPDYGQKSQFKVSPGNINVDLGPGRFHLFWIDTPNLLSSKLTAYPGLIKPLQPAYTPVNNSNTNNSLMGSSQMSNSQARKANPFQGFAS